MTRLTLFASSLFYFFCWASVGCANKIHVPRVSLFQLLCHDSIQLLPFQQHASMHQIKEIPGT